MPKNFIAYLYNIHQTPSVIMESINYELTNTKLRIPSMIVDDTLFCNTDVVCEGEILSKNLIQHQATAFKAVNITKAHDSSLFANVQIDWNYNLYYSAIDELTYTHLVLNTGILYIGPEAEGFYRFTMTGRGPDQGTGSPFDDELGLIPLIRKSDGPELYILPSGDHTFWIDTNAQRRTFEATFLAPLSGHDELVVKVWSKQSDSTTPRTVTFEYIALFLEYLGPLPGLHTFTQIAP